MKIFKTIIYSLLILIVLAAVVGLIILNGISKGALPEYEGEIALSGLTDEVTVYRDERGMPHLYAGNEHDLYLATGYIMAQERLWQMDLIRRATTGRLSEIFGEDYKGFDGSTDWTQTRNGQTIYAAFIITNIQKSIKEVKIECMQLHKLNDYGIVRKEG